MPLYTGFDYSVPAGMSLQVGMRVRVPFGKRRLQGVVTVLKAASAAKGLRPVEAVLDVAPLLDKAALEFTRWVADYYLCPWGQVLPMMLPVDWKPRAQAILSVEDAAALRALCSGLGPRQARSRALLERLAGEGCLDLGEAKQAGLTDAVLKQALAAGALSRGSRATDAAVPAPGSASKAPKLTEAQAQASLAIADAIQAGKGGAFLLMGVTGSGKTEVYLDALARTLKAGGGAIVLVPEIALTPQTWSRFEGRFPGQVVVLHSGLTQEQRWRGYQALSSGKARVALGARSALFAPVHGLQLLIVDEESEPSYKQESDPRYHARDAALVRAKLHGAVAVLGSATPSFESFYNAKAGKLSLLTLPGRVGAHGLPDFEFLDLNAGPKPKEGAGAEVLLPELVNAVEAAKARHELSLLFLNRRGFAPVLACASCGQALQCPQCSISLTFHREAPGRGAFRKASAAGRAVPEDGELEAGAGWLRCHLCDHSQRPPMRCPEPKCGKPTLRPMGSGTQRLEEEVARRFPGARLARVDRDTASGAEFHSQLGERVREGSIDILLGTQMLAKGLDFPQLTTVGVINADASLNFPDFRASERTFQLLVQVAGRAGRADKPGQVFVQTRQPQHPCLQAAARQDFEAFYASHTPERKALGYPPYGRLAALIFRSKDKGKAVAMSAKAAQDLKARAASLKVEILGPAPAPLVLIKEWWRYRLLFRCPSSQALHQLLEPWVRAYKDQAVAMAVDVDPLNFM